MENVGRHTSILADKSIKMENVGVPNIFQVS